MKKRLVGVCFTQATYEKINKLRGESGLSWSALTEMMAKKALNDASFITLLGGPLDD